MAKLPRVKASEVITALERLGFAKVRQKGSHVILKKKILINEEGIDKYIEIGCVVPMHSKDIAVGTLKNILSQAKVIVEDFLENF